MNPWKLHTIRAAAGLAWRDVRDALSPYLSRDLSTHPATKRAEARLRLQRELWGVLRPTPADVRDASRVATHLDAARATGAPADTDDVPYTGVVGPIATAPYVPGQTPAPADFRPVGWVQAGYYDPTPVVPEAFRRPLAGPTELDWNGTGAQTYATNLVHHRPGMPPSEDGTVTNVLADVTCPTCLREATPELPESTQADATRAGLAFLNRTGRLPAYAHAKTCRAFRNYEWECSCGAQEAADRPKPATSELPEPAPLVHYFAADPDRRRRVSEHSTPGENSTVTVADVTCATCLAMVSRAPLYAGPLSTAIVGSAPFVPPLPMDPAEALRMPADPYWAGLAWDHRSGPCGDQTCPFCAEATHRLLLSVYGPLDAEEGDLWQFRGHEYRLTGGQWTVNS